MAYKTSDYDKAERQAAAKANRAIDQAFAIADSDQYGATEAVIDCLQSNDEGGNDGLGYLLGNLPCWAQGDGDECYFYAEDIEAGIEAVCMDCGQPELRN